MLLKGELFLAWRYLKPQKTMISMLTYISLLGPILGVGILIVVSSVMSGIPREFEKTMISYSAHITITSRKALNNTDELLKHIDKKYGFRCSPVTVGPVLIEAKSGKSEVLGTKGIIPENDKNISKLKEMIEGQLNPEFALKTNEVILSQYICKELDIKLGDEIILHSPEKYKNQINGDSSQSLKSAAKFIVAKIFFTGIPEIDKRFMICHFSAANELMVLRQDQATQIEIALDNPQEAELVAQKLSEDSKFRNMSITPWQQLPGISRLYAQMNQQKAMMTFVLFFIVIGAAIGVAACLFSLVIQKTKEIGILKATGVKPKSIIAVFLAMGAFLGSLGAALGLGGGILTLIFRQEVTKVFGLWDPELYKLEKVPVYYDLADISTILGITVLICIAASTVPAVLAAAVHPVKALQSKG